ncbi:MAG TPA: class I SAM-dependent methyltransferase, partial [Blastocatellia bacterium]|nr:class I SAM-dependent methyltransferase [Blastocatellia bacterium]
MEPASDLHRHPDTWLELSDLGRIYPPYRPTYDFTGWISPYHKSLSRAPLDGELIRLNDRRWKGERVEGWLRPADALKLYELAFFARGDVIELGTAHGLSTLIMARAIKDSRASRRILSIEISPDAYPLAVRHLRRSGLSKYTELAHDWTERVIDACDKRSRKFAFAFVDHAHTYDAVL